MQNAFKYYKMAKYLASVHTAQKKNNKRLSKKPDPHQFSMSQTRVVPNPPLRKSLNIYIFNPIKNVTNKKKTGLSHFCHAAKY